MKIVFFHLNAPQYSAVIASKAFGIKTEWQPKTTVQYRFMDGVCRLGETMTDDFRNDLFELLEECAYYFSDREDADQNGERYIPNKEMKLRQSIIEIEARLEKQS